MGSEGLERRLAAIMFTDIAGYTATMAESETRGLAARRRHRELVAPLVERFGGELIEARGDESLSVFRSALDAVRCAQAVGRSTAAGPGELRLHIGIHTGEVVLQGGEVSGDAVNIASRVCAASAPGEILISGELWASLRNQPGIGARSLGLRSLKNVGRPVEIYALATSSAEQAVEEASALSGEPTIAVLPFVNMSSDPENEYLGDGIAEELINGLSKVAGLKVVARTSAFYFKGRERDLREVGRNLNVSTVLEGSVRKSGDRVRITAQLINVSSGYHLWSGRYDREMSDIFELEDDVAANVIDVLRSKLQATPSRPTVHSGRTETTAYELYLRGRYFLEKRSGDALRTAARYLEQANQEDPDYAPVLAWKALNCDLLGIYAGPPHEWFPEAERWAARALALDPRSAIALAALGYARALYRWEWTGAVEHLGRAVELDPDSSQARAWYASLLFCVGAAESHQPLRSALQRDPLSGSIGTHLAEQLFALGRLEEAMAQVEATLEIHPDYFPAHCILGRILLASGRPGEAIAACKRALEVSGGASVAVAHHGWVCARASQVAKARAALEELERRSSRAYEPPALLAYAAAGLGDTESALAHLLRGLDARDTWLVPLFRLRGFEELADQPRFQEIIAEIGLPDRTGS